MIIAGEASGDTYGAEIVSEMKNRYGNIYFEGIGGSKMRANGVTLYADASDMAVVGIVEVIKHIDVIAPVFFKLKKIINSESKPDLLILIDYPGFNLKMASVAKKAGVKTLYYISPQIWAWKKGRIKKIKEVADHMAVILPFEEDTLH